jgi:hypothetical protein
MKRLFFSLAFMTVCLSCTDVGSPIDREPDWVQKMIHDFEAAPVGNPPQSVWKYEYLGSTVYYVPPQCCDQFGNLYDARGNIICHPDGGIGGTGDGRCTDFRSKRQNEVLVWRDPRGR